MMVRPWDQRANQRFMRCGPRAGSWSTSADIGRLGGDGLSCARADRRRDLGGVSLEATVAGSIIVLNGTSSAGKSTLAAELQRCFTARDDCWLIFGIDDFLPRLPVE